MNYLTYHCVLVWNTGLVVAFLSVSFDCSTWLYMQTQGLIARDKDNVDYSSSSEDEKKAMVVSYKSTQSAVSLV